MIDMSRVSDPSLQYSDESEGTELREFVDRRLSHHPPGATPSPPPSPSPPTGRSRYRSSSASESPLESPDRRKRSSKKYRDHHSSQKEIVKLLLTEEFESTKHTRKLLRSALDRLDAESQRAREAERRALEVAERFKEVSQKALNLQVELDRTKHELNLYKVQYGNAQQEILRGQDILKELEAQRDDAEASAARARSTARRLREERLKDFAKEEGRKEGYDEGFNKGLAEGRNSGYFEAMSELKEDEDAAEEVDPPEQAGDSGPVNTRTAPLDNLSVLNLPQAGESDPQPSFPAPENAPGAQGSRFHEDNMTPGSTPTFPAPKPMHNAPPSFHHPETVKPPDNWIPDLGRGIPPPHEFNQPPPSPHSPSQALPIPIPPPRISVGAVHTSDSSATKDYDYENGRSSPQRSLAESVPSSFQSSTMSTFEILRSPKTAARNSARENRDRGRDRGPGLDVIHEVSSSMEYSPGKDSRGMPEPIVFPVPSGDQTDWESEEKSRTPRSRKSSARQGEEVRYSNPEAVDEWRRMAADEFRTGSPASGSRPRSAAPIPSPLAESARSQSRNGGRPPSAMANSWQPPPDPSRRSNRTETSSSGGRHDPQNTSSGDISINIEVEPPSQPESEGHFSPEPTMNELMLSPNSAPAPLPEPVEEPVIPTVPNTPTLGNQPSMGFLPSELPPGFIPLGPPMPSPGPVDRLGMGTPVAHSSPRVAPAPIGFAAPPGAITSVPVPTRSSTSSSSSGRKSKHSRSRSTSQLGMVNPEDLPSSLRVGTPGADMGPVRPPSGMSNTSGRSKPSIYPSAPGSSSNRYPNPPFIRAGGRSDNPLIPPPIDDPVIPDNLSLRSGSSKFSMGHQRSLSLNAGMTPAHLQRPLSSNAAPPPGAQLRRMPSNESMGSGVSGASRPVYHFDPSKYVDIAYAASSEDLLANVQSPNTSKNTRSNAGEGGPGMRRIPPPSLYSAGGASPSMSYSSLPSRRR